MKQTLTFHLSTIASTESKINVDLFDESLEALNNGDYTRSFYVLLDYVNANFRAKYGNTEGTEFNIPHGSIVVTLKLEDEQLKITAPFLSLPEKNRVPLLRQVAGLNFNDLDLTQIILQDDRLFSPKSKISIGDIGKTGGIGFGTGGSLTYVARQNFGMKLFVDYNFQHPIISSDRHKEHVVTLGGAVNIMF